LVQKPQSKSFRSRKNVGLTLLPIGRLLLPVGWKDLNFFANFEQNYLVAYEICLNLALLAKKVPVYIYAHVISVIFPINRSKYFYFHIKSDKPLNNMPETLCHIIFHVTRSFTCLVRSYPLSTERWPADVQESSVEAEEEASRFQRLHRLILRTSCIFRRSTTDREDSLCNFILALNLVRNF